MEQLVTSEVKTRRDPNPAFSFCFHFRSPIKRTVSGILADTANHPTFASDTTNAGSRVSAVYKIFFHMLFITKFYGLSAIEIIALFNTQAKITLHQP
jgi:hypothetical protein